MPLSSPTFEERYPVIVHEINKREKRWDLAAIAFEDARQMILLRIYLKYHLYDETKGDFLHWVNRLITNAIYTIFRDHLTIYSRPCILGCVFNTGGDTCSKTSSGKQCAQCPLYRDWERRKKDHHAIKQALPLENHMQEVNNKQSDFMDIEGKKQVIDAQMRKRLTKHEYRIYHLLYIKGKKEEEVGRLMGYKRKPNQRMHAGYQIILKVKKLIVATAKKIISDENLA